MGNLFAPQAYWDLTPEAKAEICNGCGTKGLGGWLVPDTLWGLSITEPCHIHDFGYFVGKTLEDKEREDRIFLNNMLRVIEAANKWYDKLLKPLRRMRAMKYYSAVKDFGGPAFWSGKNKSQEEREVK